MAITSNLIQFQAPNTAGAVRVNNSLNLGARTSIEDANPSRVFNGTDWVLPAGTKMMKGLGVDLNGDGKFERGTDGHLVFDLDGNGRYERSEIADSLDLLKLFSGAGDLSTADQSKILQLQQKSRQLDLDRDGVLSSWELTKAGARVLVSDAEGTGNSILNTTLPGSAPVTQPRFQSPRFPSPFFGGYAPFGPTNFGPAAFFFQVFARMFSMYSRPF